MRLGGAVGYLAGVMACTPRLGCWCRNDCPCVAGIWHTAGASIRWSPGQLCGSRWGRWMATRIGAHIVTTQWAGRGGNRCLPESEGSGQAGRLATCEWQAKPGQWCVRAQGGMRFVGTEGRGGRGILLSCFLGRSMRGCWDGWDLCEEQQQKQKQQQLILNSHGIMLHMMGGIVGDLLSDGL
jgi:hypothetical protein